MKAVIYARYSSDNESDINGRINSSGQIHLKE